VLVLKKKLFKYIIEVKKKIKEFVDRIFWTRKKQTKKYALTNEREKDNGGWRGDGCLGVYFLWVFFLNIFKFFEKY
jgi:hypothetical protein